MWISTNLFNSSAQARLVRLYLTLVVVLGAGVLLGSTLLPSISRAATGDENASLTTIEPRSIAGFTGQEDERDADLYPAIAYHPEWDVYLVVWMSLANASGSGDGFDLYGVFLHPTGAPITQAFRISDTNRAARSSQPTVLADQDGFLVMWTRRGSPCRLVMQRVTSTSSQTDRVMELGLHVDQHSPQIFYNAERETYVVTFVGGDDYMPPKLFNADVADCGDNRNSSSQIRMAEFTLDNEGAPQVERTLIISEASGGAFRPKLAYNPAQAQYLVIWEDRRRGSDHLYRFDVYAQRVDMDVTLTGTNLALATGIYENSDTSATWTPRPALSENELGFLAAWFQPERLDNSTTWEIRTRRVSVDGQLTDAETAMQTTLVAPPADNAPSGFLAVNLDARTQNHLLVTSGHIDTLSGYYSSVRLQRVRPDGELRTLGGALQASATFGTPLDPVIDDQFQVAMAQRPVSPNRSEHILVYARRSPGMTSQDFDIWAVRILSGSHGKRIYVPTLINR